MQRSLFFKSIIVFVLMLLIGIPLMMIQSTISERMRYRDEAVRSIAADSVSEQTILGPVLVIPYSESFEQEEILDVLTKKSVTRRYTIQHRHYVYPNQLTLKGNIDTDHRYRGIHKVLVYSGLHLVNGDFVLPGIESLAKDKAVSQLTLGTPFVSLGLSDTRGLRNFPSINWNGKAYEFKQESKLRSFQNGLHAPLAAMDLIAPATIKFSLELAVDGIERLSFIPIAKNNMISLKSKWPHPQFGGRFLPSPKERTIDQNGFSANWNISALSSNAQQQFTAMEIVKKEAASEGTGVAQAAPYLDSFSVAFIEPINVYSQADRAIKYGMLFIALALFFLLLVSLSEHINFMRAYLIASSACIVLIGVYLSYALHSWKRGMGFGCALTLLYGVLFGLLQSESNALIMGSILLFAVLTAIMMVTRKVDWYQLGKTPL